MLKDLRATQNILVMVLAMSDNLCKYSTYDLTLSILSENKRDSHNYRHDARYRSS